MRKNFPGFANELSNLNCQPNHLSFLIVAGEASGDAHAAALVRALRATAADTEFDFFGSTGKQMRDAGVESIVKADQLAIMGLWEVGRALPKFWSAFAELKRAAGSRRPDAAILVDWPDFNLRLARWLHRQAVPVIYYVSPQLWAWRSYRVRSVRRDVDLLLSILPFEKAWYAARGITKVEYVGHPLTGEVRAQCDREEFCRRHDLNPSQPVLAFLPGSRHKELAHILPPMIDAIQLLQKTRPEIQSVVVVAPNRSIDEAEAIAAAHCGRQQETLRFVHHETREALSAADAAAVASGTATLEAALLGTPMTVVYKESAINWHALRRLISTEHFGLVNLIAGRRLATELMQDGFTGESLAQEMISLLEPERNRDMRAELNEVTKNIGEPGASVRAARAILNFMEQRKV